MTGLPGCEKLSYLKRAVSRAMNATHLQALSAFSFPVSGPGPGPSGNPESHRSGARGSEKLQAYSSRGWHGRVAWPHLRLGFPPLSLGAELAGPHRLLGSLCLINGAGDACGA